MNGCCWMLMGLGPFPFAVLCCLSWLLRRQDRDRHHGVLMVPFALSLLVSLRLKWSLLSRQHRSFQALLRRHHRLRLRIALHTQLHHPPQPSHQSHCRSLFPVAALLPSSFVVVVVVCGGDDVNRCIYVCGCVVSLPDDRGFYQLSTQNDCFSRKSEHKVPSK